MAESLGDFRYKGTNILAARLTKKQTGKLRTGRFAESPGLVVVEFHFPVQNLPVSLPFRLVWLQTHQNINASASLS